MTQQEMKKLLPARYYFYDQYQRKICFFKRSGKGVYHKSNALSLLCRIGLINGELTADRLNNRRGVTIRQAYALVYGSVRGWEHPSADPRNLDSITMTLNPDVAPKGKNRAMPGTPKKKASISSQLRKKRVMPSAEKATRGKQEKRRPGPER